MKFNREIRVSITRTTGIWWAFYFAFVFLPIFTVFWMGVPLDRPVTSTYISGFITASGIFLGLLVTALINKSEVLEHNLKFAIYLDLALFGGALVQIFGSALQSDPKVINLTITMMSLMADVSTALAIINRIR